jgi:hypothetical protein
MKDPYEVLYQKEAALARVRHEIESLTMVASLLADDDLTFFDSDTAPDPQKKKPMQKATPPEVSGTESQPFVWPRTGFWSSLNLKR